MAGLQADRGARRTPAAPASARVRALLRRVTLPRLLSWGRVTARPLSPHRVRRTLELRVHDGINDCLRGLIFVRPQADRGVMRPAGVFLLVGAAPVVFSSA